MKVIASAPSGNPPRHGGVPQGVDRVRLSCSLPEEAVDVLVGDLGERGVDSLVPALLLLLDLPLDRLEDPLEVLRRLADAKPHEAERRALVEDDDEDDPLPDDGDVDVVLLALVEEDGELLLADELREAVRRRDVAGGEGREGG